MNINSLKKNSFYIPLNINHLKKYSSHNAPEYHNLKKYSSHNLNQIFPLLIGIVFYRENIVLWDIELGRHL